MDHEASNTINNNDYAKTHYNFTVLDPEANANGIVSNSTCQKTKAVASAWYESELVVGQRAITFLYRQTCDKNLTTPAETVATETQSLGDTSNGGWIGWAGNVSCVMNKTTDCTLATANYTEWNAKVPKSTHSIPKVSDFFCGGRAFSGCFNNLGLGRIR